MKIYKPEENGNRNIICTWSTTTERKEVSIYSILAVMPDGGSINVQVDE